MPFPFALLALIAAATSHELAEQAVEHKQPSSNAQDDELSLLQSHLAVDENRGDSPLEVLGGLKVSEVGNIARAAEAQYPDLFGGQSPVSIITELAGVLRNSVVIDTLKSAFVSAGPIALGFASRLTGNITTLRATVTGSSVPEDVAAMKTFMSVEIADLAESYGTIRFSLKPALDQVPAGGFLDRLLPGLRETLAGTKENWVQNLTDQLTNSTNDFLDGDGDMCARFESWEVMQVLSTIHQYVGVKLPGLVTQVQSVATTVIPVAGLLFSDVTQTLQQVVDTAVQFSQDALTPLGNAITDVQNTITETVNITFGCNTTNRTILGPRTAASSSSSHSDATSSSSSSSSSSTASGNQDSTSSTASGHQDTASGSSGSTSAEASTTEAEHSPTTTTTTAASGNDHSSTSGHQDTASGSSHSTSAEASTTEAEHSSSAASDSSHSSSNAVDSTLRGDGHRAGLGLVAIGLILTGAAV